MTGEAWGQVRSVVNLLRAEIDAVSGEAKRKIYGLNLAPRITNGLATYLYFNKHFIFVFSTQVSYSDLSLKLSCNLIDFNVFPRNSP